MPILSFLRSLIEHGQNPLKCVRKLKYLAALVTSHLDKNTNVMINRVNLFKFVLFSQV